MDVKVIWQGGMQLDGLTGSGLHMLLGSRTAARGERSQRAARGEPAARPPASPLGRADGLSSLHWGATQGEAVLGEPINLSRPTGQEAGRPGRSQRADEGDEQGFLPMELLATGMAGCTALDVISILQKKGQEVTGFEVQAHIQRSPEHPRVFTHATIEYLVTGRGVDEAAVVRSIELSATRYCPALAMFKKVFPIELKYHLFEAGEDGTRQLVKSGEYVLLV